jgi:hypothetical protein
MPDAAEGRASRPLTIAVRDNPDKAGALWDALRRAGHHLVVGPGDILLTDIEIPLPPFQHLLDANERIVVYPHGPGTLTHADGIWPVHRNTIGCITIGEGPAKAMRAYGYDRALHPIGWPYGALRRNGSSAGRRVLFAPVHADGYGYSAPENLAANAEVFDRLCQLVTAGDIELSVRYVGSLRSNGLVRRPGVKYLPVGHQGGLTWRPPAADIDDADVVVALGTFMFTAVSRGAPTIGFGQHLWSMDWRHPGQHLHARTWPRYRPLYDYPYEALARSITDADDLGRMIETVCSSDADIAEWRQHFIGDPFDPASFVALVEQLATS